ncbi:PAS domain-containing protein [Acerihabitans sp. TG2]|uniref:LuxR C-terminal-related transcriptional regulator n=1 Tax=Acerihabitans sp. TG2 TaxID=3096008 RepID=UPI002B22BD60|nr:PAS domain-containing protein [Acerihabitans sp. TG2]MEA9393264.1 PAS domain-containing protein [Acerihabitans sp. TG2]
MIDVFSKIQEIDLSKCTRSLLDQLNFSFIIRNKEGRLIYCNQATAELYGVKSPSCAMGKLDNEIKSKLFDDVEVVDGFSKQYKKTWETETSYSTLELHPTAVDYPYIFHKIPFFNNNKECVGMFGYDKKLNVYSINDFIKRNLPGSLLLTKPDDYFTERQCEIFFYRLQGLKAKEVAKRLHLAANTFNNYMQTLYDKVGANNLDEFIEFCEKRNYHRYLPKRFLTSEAITFDSSII